MSMISQDHPIILTIAAAEAAHGAAVGDKAPVKSAIHRALSAKEFMPQVAHALDIVSEFGVIQDGEVWAWRSDVATAFMRRAEEYPRYSEAMFWRQVENAFELLSSVPVRWFDYQAKTTARLDEMKKPKRRSLSDARFLHVLNRDGYSCRWCGSTEDLTVDHITPVIRGGTNHLDNLQTLCRSCNSRKGVRT